MPKGDSQPKVWPMAGVAATVLVFIIGYTFITIAYRKPNKAYEPYHDTRTRVNTARLLAAGYRRVELPVQAPADTIPLRNAALPAPGGIPAQLKETTIDEPALPDDIVEVEAPSATAAATPYEFRFRCRLADDERQLASLTLYIKADTLVFAPSFERLDGGLQTRTRQPVFSVVVPPGTLEPGQYTATALGEHGSRTWLLRVD